MQPPRKRAKGTLGANRKSEASSNKRAVCAPGFIDLVVDFFRPRQDQNVKADAKPQDSHRETRFGDPSGARHRNGAKPVARRGHKSPATRLSKNSKSENHSTKARRHTKEADRSADASRNSGKKRRNRTRKQDSILSEANPPSAQTAEKANEVKEADNHRGAPIDQDLNDRQRSNGSRASSQRKAPVEQPKTASPIRWLTEDITHHRQAAVKLSRTSKVEWRGIVRTLHELAEQTASLPDKGAKTSELKVTIERAREALDTLDKLAKELDDKGWLAKNSKDADLTCRMLQTTSDLVGRLGDQYLQALVFEAESSPPPANDRTRAGATLVEALRGAKNRLEKDWDGPGTLHIANRVLKKLELIPASCTSEDLALAFPWTDMQLLLVQLNSIGSRAGAPSAQVHSKRLDKLLSTLENFESDLISQLDGAGTGRRPGPVPLARVKRQANEHAVAVLKASVVGGIARATASTVVGAAVPGPNMLQIGRGVVNTKSTLDHLADLDHLGRWLDGRKNGVDAAIQRLFDYVYRQKERKLMRSLGRSIGLSTLVDGYQTPKGIVKYLKRKGGYLGNVRKAHAEAFVEKARSGNEDQQQIARLLWVALSHHGRTTFSMTHWDKGDHYKDYQALRAADKDLAVELVQRKLSPSG